MPRTKTTWPTGGHAKPPTRGPTGKHAQKNPASYIQPSEADMQPYMQRYLNGESLRMICTELGLSPQQLSRRFTKFCLSGRADKSYADCVTDALVDRIALADIALGNARSMADIARADKVCRYSRMDFERRRPHLYGQRAEITFAGPAAIFLGLEQTVLQAAGQAALQAVPIIANPLMILEHEAEPGDATTT